MPELPDVLLYIHALEPRVVGETLERVRLASPFLLRSVEPRIQECENRKVLGLRRLGKRIVFELEGDLFLVFHLMIAGRFRWRPARARIPGKLGLAAFDLSSGTLVLTEAGSIKRASLHAVRGRENLRQHDPGGIEVLDCGLDDFRRVLAGENHTLKRSLTDPRLFSGIGNAYSDEILHRARLSPMKQTRHLDEAEIGALHAAVREVLEDWCRRLREESGDDFPEKVTAFRPGMAVHGKYREPCPECGARVQRIRYAANECNYCAKCQTGGRLLADRSLSRLMKSDWPRTLEELEEIRTERSL